MHAEAIEPEATEPGAIEPDVDGPDADRALDEAVIAVDLDADLEAVWQALTTEEGLAEWIGAGSTIGASPGDELRFRDTVSGENKRGFLDEVTPRRRLGYTWWPETDPERSTRVAISLEPSRTGTRVTVVESRPRTVTPRMASPTPSGANRAAPSASMAAVSPASMLRADPATTDWLWRQAMLAVSLRTAVAETARSGR